MFDRNRDIEAFGFVTRSFWHEVDGQIRMNLPNVTAPGNPDQFQRRFKDTFNFLNLLASNHDDGFLFEDDSLHEHLKRFNLAVYFEIRFQQVATKFEREALRNSVLDEDCAAEDGGPFRLNVTRALRDCTARCFDPDVFLVQMADQIFRLAMMLLSRYFKSLDTNLEASLPARFPVFLDSFCCGCYRCGKEWRRRMRTNSSSFWSTR